MPRIFRLNHWREARGNVVRRRVLSGRLEALEGFVNCEALRVRELAVREASTTENILDGAPKAGDIKANVASRVVFDHLLEDLDGR